MQDSNYIEAQRPQHPEWDNINTQDLVALRGYTSEDYRMLNGALRNGDSQALGQLGPYIDAAKAGLDGMPSYQGLVTRGVDLSDTQAARYVPGETITENAFTSAAANPSAAFQKNTVMTIQSFTGKDISALSNYPNETEVLFPPGTSFEVIENSVDPSTGVRNIGLIQTGGN